MPTPIEVRVLKILSAIEIDPSTAQTIENLGNEAVTVVCEIALGSYPGLRLKVRTNAVALLGWMTHPQAVETIPLLINDSNSDVSIRAMRAAGRQKNEQVISKLDEILKKTESLPLIAAEAVKALISINSVEARTSLSEYSTTDGLKYPHRNSTVVKGILNAYNFGQ